MEKPKIEHVTFYRTEGCFNLFNPKERSAQYVFGLPHLTREQINEKELKTSFLIDLEKDYDFDPNSYTALEVAYEIKNILDSYWIHSGKQEIQKFVEYLESIEEEQEKLRHQYAIENAKYQISYWQNELESLQELAVNQ